MKHYGDVSKINGGEIEPVDVITFGSPCQDMSVAGKREGMKHSEQGDEETTRSGLFYEAVRIIEEMRKATNGEYPKYAVWENVPGAFSSNKGRDFHAALEALCSVCDDTVSIPEPYDKKRTKLVWNKAGEIVGDNYSVAWRTLDAQYWGVPQRRKRIYLVADFTGRCAGEILFKPDSLRGDMPQGNEAGQEVTADAVGGVDGSVGVECIGFDMYNQASTDDKTRTLKTPVGGDDLPVVVLKERAGCAGGGKGALWSNKAFTLATNQDMSVIALQANGIDRADTGGCYGSAIPINTMTCQGRPSDNGRMGLGIGEDGDPANTLSVGHCHAVCFEPGAMVRDMGNRIWEGQSPTLRATMGDNQPAVCFDRATFNQGINVQYDFEVSQEGVVSTVVAKGPSGVCYDARGNGDGETACTITGDHQNRITDYTAGAVQSSNSIETYHCTALEEGATTLKARDWKDPQCVSYPSVGTLRKYIIRRLTPRECARLQGFSDNWGQLAPYNPADAEFWEDVRKTHAEINGKKYKPVKDIKKWYEKLHTDSAEYKAYGNGLALPCAEFVIRGIAEVLRNEKGQFASKGGVIEHKGYTCIYKPEHPRAKTNGYVREHILVAEEMLGRPLDGEEVVHHINGDKADNRPENLEIFPTHAEHVRHHNRTDGKKYSYNGGEFTVAELSEFSVVDYSVLTQRINKLGWDIKRAVETPKRGQPTLGSLFDGIGGFPLAGIMNGITPLWASEVEPYPIAVTKSRFKEVHNGRA